METYQGSSESQRNSSPIVYETERRKMLENRLAEEKGRLELLPKTSKYVMHRLRVVNRAIALMSQSELEGQSVADELARLLDSLSL